MRCFIYFAVALLAISCSGVRDGHYELTVAATGDGHGSWFSEPLTDKPVRGSLASVAAAVSDLRDEGEVLLVDAGDYLTGGDANFYFDADTYIRMASFLSYDAVTIGAGDFEAVNEDFISEMEKEGIPVLAGNNFVNGLHEGREGRQGVGKDQRGRRPYYTIVHKGGLKVAVLGYTNATAKSQVHSYAVEDQYFRAIGSLVQQDVDRVIAKEKPQVVVVVAHTGMGKADGNRLSHEGAALFSSLRGVDFLITGYDHVAKVQSTDSICVLNAGKGYQNLAVGKVSLDVKGSKVVSKTLSSSLQKLSASVVDSAFVETFRPEYEELKAFVSAPIGEITDTLVSREFYWGQCDYLNFLHALALWAYDWVDISLESTLLIDDIVPAGKVAYKDIAKIYPFDNRLIVIRMTGQEVKDYLEASYDAWVSEPGSAHVLRMKQAEEYRTKKKVWKLVNSPANFDSAAGICYTVNLERPAGSRVEISSMADGKPFSLSDEYRVGITSYRATGSGRLLQAAGIDVPDGLEKRLSIRANEFRSILYCYIKEHGRLSPEDFSDPSIVGSWSFLPSEKVDKIKAEVEMIYGK